MSLGSMPQQRKFSDAQFVGDLMGLLKRHRIASAEAGGLAQFESSLASKDTFRSQLFTLCTAISHMAEEDLSGEELLALIGRAIGVSSGAGTSEIPDSLRSAFLSGYTSWSNRVLNEQDVWPPERKVVQAHEPIPFPKPTEPLPEPEYGLRVPGLPTVQEALLMAKKQAPFELPLRGANLPVAGGASPVQATAGPAQATASQSPSAGSNVENLTISELTQLLEDIERRMSRIKPHVHELTALIQPPLELLDRADRTRDEEAARTAAIGPALVRPRVESTMDPVEMDSLIAHTPENDPFVARHSYLNPNSRRRVSLAPPAPLFVPPPPPPVIEAVAVPVDVSEQADTKRTTDPPSAGSFLTQYKNIDAAIAAQPDSYRVLVHVAIGVLAAVILVAIPLAAVMIYRSSRVQYEYHNLQPAAQPATSTTGASAGVGTNSQPAANGASSQPITPASSQKAKSRTTKHKPPLPVEVWPPPPSR